MKGGRLMEKTILNFHFDYLNSSLISAPKTFISQLEAFTERRFNGRKTASRLLFKYLKWGKGGKETTICCQQSRDTLPTIVNK